MSVIGEGGPPKSTTGHAHVSEAWSERAGFKMATTSGPASGDRHVTEE